MKTSICSLILGLVLATSISLLPIAANAIELDAARAIAAKAEAFAKKSAFTVSVAIVDEGGNLVYFQRGPGAYIGSVEASVAKARSANAFHRPTKAFEEAVAGGRTALLSLDGVVAIEGGVPITIGGRHVGAIGVSGAKAPEDGQVAEAALR
jgi:uncharacterized protein GlcG (DUF336 family)